MLTDATGTAEWLINVDEGDLNDVYEQAMGDQDIAAFAALIAGNISGDAELDETYTVSWTTDGLTHNSSYEAGYGVFFMSTNMVTELSFFCGDGSEVPFEWVNDGYDDCADGADEQQYNDTGDPINWFDCSDGSQVWVYQVNDGVEDCPNGEDEGIDDGEVYLEETYTANGTNHTSQGLDFEVFNDTCFVVIWSNVYEMTGDWENASFGGEYSFLAGPDYDTDDDMDGWSDCLVQTLSMDILGDEDDDDDDDDGPSEFSCLMDDLIISELHSSGTPMNWIEIQHVGHDPCSLLGWTLFDTDGPSAGYTFGDVVLYPGDFYLGYYYDPSGDFEFTFDLTSGEMISLMPPGGDHTNASMLITHLHHDNDPTSSAMCLLEGEWTIVDTGNAGTPGYENDCPLPVWPSEDDLAAFDNEVWGFASQWDNDSNGAISFDEYWQLQSDVGLVPSDMANPGWTPDSTEWDMFPLNALEQSDNDMDGIGDNEDNDDDNDNYPDSQDAFPYDDTEWGDMDGDGIGDNSDPDRDGDGTDNENDSFDSDAGASADFDQDGADDESDTDDDNDGFPDVSDWAPYDPTEWADSDGDGIGDNADTDDDNDEVLDVDDAFPTNPAEVSDADGDGIGDNADPDDDNDDTPDGLDAFPTDPNEQRDYDGDGIGDNSDPDMDEDGVLNSDDAFPLNAAESVDTDGDNIGDNSDADIDGDDVLNADDLFPNDATEWADTDGDGLGDELQDDDDDGDGYSDTNEHDCGTDSKNPNSVPSDYDGDGICDAMDSTPTGDRTDAADGQEEPGFTPGFPSVLAAISLLGAAALGRRKED